MDANTTINISGQPAQDFYALAEQAEAQGQWRAAAVLYARAASQRTAELDLIGRVQEGLSSRLEMQAIYNLVGDCIRDTFNAQVVMISQFNPQTRQIYHHYAIERGQHLTIPGWRPIDSSRALIVQTARPYLINLAEIIALVEEKKMQVVPGTELPKTWLGVPMLVGSEVRGVVSMQNLDMENAFSAFDINLLTALVNSMSQSLENARLYKETQRLFQMIETEMETARQTQQSILPRTTPKHPGYDFGSLIIPARAVGGDFYDFIPLGRRRLCLVLGDVSDKGMHAALFMALTLSLLRAETRRRSDPLKVLLNVNRDLVHMNSAGMFVTLLYGVLDLHTGELEYWRAGHIPPLVVDAAGNILKTSIGEGQPLGLFYQVKLDHQRLTIPPGGLALLFSDGLNEAVNSHGSEFGISRVAEVLAEQRHSGSEGICQALWQAVQGYSLPLDHQDDFTTLVIKRK